MNEVKLIRGNSVLKPLKSRGFVNNVSQLACLANLENLNALFINEEQEKAERLTLLNRIAIQQMRILFENRTTIKLEGK